MNTPADVPLLLKRIATAIASPDEEISQLHIHLDPLPECFDDVRALLPQFELTDDEIQVIALLHSGQPLSRLSACCPVQIGQVVVALKAKGIADEIPADTMTEESDPTPSLRLHAEFAGHILAQSSCLIDKNIEPFANLRAYLLHWFHFVKRLQKYRENERNQHPIHGIAGERSMEQDSSPTRTERKFAEEERELIKRSQIDWEHFPIERVVHLLGLDHHERNILLFVLAKELDNDRCTIDDLLPLVSKDVLDGLDSHRYWKPTSLLRVYDLISIEDSRQVQRLRTQVTMRPAVKRWLATGAGTVTGITDIDDRAPYASEYEQIEDWIRYGRMWMRLSRLVHADKLKGIDDDPGDIESQADFHPSSHPLLASMKARIQRKSEASTGQFPLDILTARHELNDTERDVLVLLIESATAGRDLDLDDLILHMAPDPVERQQLIELLGPDAKLVLGGLVLVSQRRNGTAELSLPLSIRNFLLGVSDYPEPTLKQMLSGDSLLTVIHPTSTMDDLVLPVDIMDLLWTGVNRYTSNVNHVLREWGILPSTGDSRVANEPASMLILFSGASGTGKTLAAFSFAGSLGKDLIVTDCSRILDVWFGNSEKNVSQLFSTIRSINQRVDNPPVFLLNEADQLLGRRMTHSQRSTDRTYSQIQNLFLENLEGYSGILIATTNLIDSIDEAFSRRFDIKITFPMPDAAARFELWDHHLPPTVPLAEDVDIGILADTYEITGGQIALAVKHAATTAAIRSDRVCMSDLVAACRVEVSGAFDSLTRSRKRQVGFCIEPELRTQDCPPSQR